MLHKYGFDVPKWWVDSFTIDAVPLVCTQASTPNQAVGRFPKNRGPVLGVMMLSTTPNVAFIDLDRPCGYGDRRNEFFYKFRDVANKKNSRPRENVTTVEEVGTRGTSN